MAIAGLEEVLWSGPQCKERVGLEIRSCTCPEVGLEDCCRRNTGRVAKSVVVLCSGGARDEFEGGRRRKYCFYL